MDLKYLQTFQTIVKEGSFSKAAVKLNYTQSTITFQIGQLEQELSAKLFEKIGRRMVLTKAGEQLIPYVEDVINSVDKMRCFERDLAKCQDNLRIGVGESLLCYLLPSVLKEFHNRAPKAKLYLHSMNCYDIRDELMNGTLDIGLFYEDVGGYGSNLVTYPFGNYPLTLVASPEIKQDYPDFITPNQKISLPLIINEPNCIFRQIFEQYLRDKAIQLDHTIELWSIPTIKNLVKNNTGISFLPRFAVLDELERGKLTEISTDIMNVRISAVCGHHKNKWISPAMELFIRLVKESTQ
ncbi:LysR family transcriptional regulator [Robinsoniella peoriensis]|uniref:HTH-type transcriptional regulator GltR n=1 Tax=Robinsoniella peoriensis TaxID=180332 RepID=A0A4U8QLK4_9FIRM|nr:LysR family transcriptional regulator [Robinsoniella peoriensis]MDU7029170.1 LysR family transcriptional regulator [Clostridiales bacterium]TLD01816.1 HTH-type transcriptional regulator GltR [Robinsoniella peoriensis]